MNSKRSSRGPFTWRGPSILHQITQGDLQVCVSAISTCYELRGEGSSEERPRRAFVEGFIFGMDLERWQTHLISTDGRGRFQEQLGLPVGENSLLEYSSSVVIQHTRVWPNELAVALLKKENGALSALTAAAALQAPGTTQLMLQPEQAVALPGEEVGGKIRQSLFLSSL